VILSIKVSMSDTPFSVNSKSHSEECSDPLMLVHVLQVTRLEKRIFIDLVLRTSEPAVLG
jgi:hypothetical protein